MNSTFIETYKHKCAKQVFKLWCSETSSFENLSWTSNREENAWLNYPIVESEKYNSMETNWDEIWPYDDDFSSMSMNNFIPMLMNNFIPTYDMCKKRNINPISVIDIVLPHKGTPKWYIEISTSNDKLEKLQKLQQINFGKYLSGGGLIEIDADWILNQTCIPSKLKYKKISTYSN
jgi:hypothetical protein